MIKKIRLWIEKVKWNRDIKKGVKRLNRIHEKALKGSGRRL